MNRNSEVRSAVVAVYDWYDGVREGVTQIGGKLYRFKSRMLDSTEYRGDIESVDLFDLMSIDDDDSLLATARFEGSPNISEAGNQNDLYAYWNIVEGLTE